MERVKSLLEPQDCTLLLVDFQAGLAFGVEYKALAALGRTGIPCGTLRSHTSDLSRSSY
jgi:hypothetical protein